MRSKNFRDFEAFAATVRDVDCVMTIQNPVHHLWSITQVKLGGMDLQLGKLGSGNIVEGQSMQDGYVLYLPLSDRIEYSANGTVLDTNSFAILEPGSEFCVSTRFEHDWCSMFIPTSMLDQAGGPDAPQLGSRKSICRVTRANRELANSARSIMSEIMSASASFRGFESSPAAISGAEALMKVASLVIGDKQEDEPDHTGRPRVSRSDIIRRSKKLLARRTGKIVRVNDLAAAAGVSERTLRAAFIEYFGTGPVHYLQLRQLHQVRHALQAADPEAASVSDVLTEHNVWEFGRFAARYRRLFGECPSESLQAAEPGRSV